MSTIGIVYFSQTDVTGQLVRAAVGQWQELGVQVVVHQIKGMEIVEGRFVNVSIMEDLKACDAIVFASPTYMGGPAAQFKAFADATSDFWLGQDWAGKLAAGMTCGSAYNGDQSATLQYFSTLASQHGMLWLGLDVTHVDVQTGLNRLGCHLGVTAHSPDGKVDDGDLNTARYLARRIQLELQPS